MLDSKLIDMAFCQKQVVLYLRMKGEIFSPSHEQLCKAPRPMMLTQQRLLEVPRGQTGKAPATTTSGGRGGIYIFCAKKLFGLQVATLSRW